MDLCWLTKCQNGASRGQIYFEDKKYLDETSLAGSATLKNAVELNFEGMDLWREKISSSAVLTYPAREQDQFW